MLDFAINNETIQGGVPVSLLTKNLIYKGYDIMAKSNIAHIKSKRQAPNKLIIKKGDPFGRLTIIKEATPHVTLSTGKLLRKFKCQCDCGNIVTVLLLHLTNGDTCSCGCLQREIATKQMTTHGLSKHLLYGIWANLKGRCSNAKFDNFSSYGGRGIIVCDKWSNNFKSFYDWAMANHWEKGLILDRKNVNGDYCPDNCRFVDAGVSARNTRPLQCNNTSGYRGVSFRKGKWVARIEYKKKIFDLGKFINPVKAALAYDAKAKEFNAEHPLNFPMEA